MSSLDVFSSALLTSLALTFLDTGYPLLFVLNLLSTFCINAHIHRSTERRIIHVSRPTIMRRYNTVSRILLILTVITFALAAPVLVQEKRQAPEYVITVLEKRIREEELDMLWDGLRYWERNRNRARLRLQDPAPPPVPPPNVADADVQDVHVPAPNPAGVHVPPQDPANPDREEMELDDDAPPGTPESGHSDSQPTSPGSTKSEDRYTAPSSESGSEPTSPGSTKSEDWYTAPSSESSTGSGSEPTSPGSTKSEDWYTAPSDSDSERWSTISNEPSAESQSEDLKAVDAKTKGKAKVLRRISGIDSGVDTVDAAQMELRSADPVPFFKN